MRHRRKVKHFGRKTTALKALWRGLIVSMVEHGRIKTTIAKAKELRSHVEKAVTLGKKNDLAARRLLLSRIPNRKTVNTIMTDISPRFMDRPGGYTRIIKIGRRPGDSSEMAFIEFIDYDWEKTSQKTSPAKSKEASDDTGVAKKVKKVTKRSSRSRDSVMKKKTSAKKTQKRSRAAARV